MEGCGIFVSLSMCGRRRGRGVRKEAENSPAVYPSACIMLSPGKQKDRRRYEVFVVLLYGQARAALAWASAQARPPRVSTFSGPLKLHNSVALGGGDDDGSSSNNKTPTLRPSENTTTQGERPTRYRLMPPPYLAHLARPPGPARVFLHTMTARKKKEKRKASRERAHTKHHYTTPLHSRGEQSLSSLEGRHQRLEVFDIGRCFAQLVVHLRRGVVRNTGGRCGGVVGGGGNRGERWVWLLKGGATTGRLNRREGVCQSVGFAPCSIRYVCSIRVAQSLSGGRTTKKRPPQWRHSLRHPAPPRPTYMDSPRTP